MSIKLDAVKLKSGEYLVRPQGELGTCGSYPFLWTGQIVIARNEDHAIQQAQSYFDMQEKRQKK